MPPAKAKTTHNDVVVIKQLANFAVRRGLIRENPLKDLKLPQPQRTPQPYWTRDEVDRIIAAASTKYQALYHFLADTGTRIGEARWLTWGDVNFEKKVVHIRSKDGWRPKTGDERVIHLSVELQHMLAQLPRSSKWVFTAPRTVRHPAAGRQVSDRRALAHLKLVLKNLELRGHLHTFRHSFISHALTSGVPEAVVREWVGHVDPAIIRHYTHIADRQSRSAMDQMLPGNDLTRSVAGDQK
jgi:integrase